MLAVFTPPDDVPLSSVHQSYVGQDINWQAAAPDPYRVDHWWMVPEGEPVDRLTINYVTSAYLVQKEVLEPAPKRRISWADIEELDDQINKIIIRRNALADQLVEEVQAEADQLGKEDEADNKRDPEDEAFAERVTQEVRDANATLETKLSGEDFPDQNEGAHRTVSQESIWRVGSEKTLGAKEASVDHIKRELLIIRASVDDLLRII